MCKSTDSGSWRELDSASLSEVASALRERGLHLTAQRQAVYEVVFGCPGHVCAEHVLAIVSERQPGLRMNKTTVYRNLDLLVGIGLVSEHRCGEGPAQYELASRGRHSHLLCSRCGALENLDEALASEFQEQLRARQGFLAEIESYPIRGLCARCRD